MVRKFLVAVTAAATALLGLVIAEGSASATPSPIPLLLPQGIAFSFLGHSCGGISEQTVTDGFDPTSGYPAGQVHLQTSCGGSGRGGGYHTTTYTAWVAVTWDLTGTVATTASSTGPTSIDPTFTAFDANGNEVYNALIAGSPATCTAFVPGCSFSADLLLANGFVPAPRLTSTSVSTGPAAGGTSVTISGTGFTGATAVDFGATPAASFVVNGDTSITAVSPPAPAGTVDVTVVSAGGPSPASPVDQFTFVEAPVVTGVSPDHGSVYGGTTVTISGRYFTDASSVSFGGTSTAFTVDSDSSITATVPAGENPDTVAVTVASVGGTSARSSADQFTYDPPSGCGTGCPAIGFSSASSATATAGVPFSFAVTTDGGTVTKLKRVGKLPKGLHFHSNGNGTGTISGTPKSTAVGTYTPRILATFGSGTTKQVVTQVFVLTVD